MPNISSLFAGLCELLLSCQRLKKLSLEHCVIDEKSCTALAQNVDLEVLNMSMCYGMGEKELKVLLEGCKKLESWNLAWTNLTAEAVNLICSMAPPTLQRINISGCRSTLKDERTSRMFAVKYQSKHSNIILFSKMS